MTQRGALLAVVASILLGGSARAGQMAGDTTGALDGRVADRTGAVLADVTVAITSAAQMGTRTAVTDAHGRYRFPFVAPGTYTIVFTRRDFATLTRHGVHVSVASAATIDVELDLATFSEGILVEHRSPVVDRQSSAIATSFDARQLATLPGSRSLFALLATTPAVRVVRFEAGGSSGDAGGPYGAHGTFGSNRPIVEGINVSGIFPTGFKLDYGSFEEVSIGTGAHGVESFTAGVQLQIVTKSGGNQYRGTFYADYEHRDWQSFNIDQDQIQRGAQGSPVVPAREANRLWRYHDINADVGGFIRKDAAWWYASFRDQDVSQRSVTFGEGPLRTRATNYTAKVTHRPAGHHRLVAYAQAGRTEQPTRLDPFGPVGGILTAATALNESASTLRHVGWGWIAKAEWNAILRERLLVEARAGEFGVHRRQTPNGTAPRFEDIGTLAVRGGNRNSQETTRRPQAMGSLTYLTDSRMGSHALKAGGELVRFTVSESWNEGYAGNVLHVLRNGAPIEVYLFQAPSRSTSGLWLYTAYATDTWRMSGRFTATLGLRFDRLRVFFPPQTHPAGRFNPVAQAFATVDNVVAWNMLTPRAGLAFDLSGDNRTIAKLSYGRFIVFPGGDPGFAANPNSTPWWRRYAWFDRDVSGVWEPGEEGPLFASRGGAALESLDPDLEPAIVDELAAGIERELPARIGVRAGIVWRSERQHWMRQDANRPLEAFSVPVAIPDPGPDGRVGTSDDGPALAGRDLPPDVLLRTPLNIVRNVPQSGSSHWTWQITAARRFAGRWSLAGGFDYTWSRDQASGYFGQAVRNNTYPVTPNDLINAGERGRYEFGTWSAKLSGTFEAPWRVRLTPLLRHQSGQPFGRTFAAALKYGTVRILAEPIDTRRMDNVTIVDVRVEKGFELPQGRRLSGVIDVFNVLNANPEQNVSWSSGSFLRPLAIVSPRIVRVGARLEW